MKSRLRNEALHDIPELADKIDPQPKVPSMVWGNLYNLVAEPDLACWGLILIFYVETEIKLGIFEQAAQDVHQARSEFDGSLFIP